MGSIRRLAAPVVIASCLAAAPDRGQATVAGAAPNRAGPAAPAACQVEGVWELVSVSNNGTDEPLRGYRQRKIVARGHYMWLGADARRDTLPLRTAADSLRMTQVAGGTGTYTVRGTTYTERLEYFVQPRMEGQSLAATCRTTRTRWEHTFTVPADSTTPGSQPARITEVWRRLR